MWPFPARVTLDGAPLYHFTAFEPARFRQIVIDNSLYFSRASDFNDPFEFSPVIDFEATITDPVERRKFIDEYQDTLRAAGHIARLEAEQDDIQRAYDDPDHVRRAYANAGDSIARYLQSTYRVFCVSTMLHAVLMWSHYAAKHQGIAYEFASTGDFFGGAFAVDYCDAPQPINPQQDPFALFAPAFLAKALSWQHENEYRILGSEDPKIPGLPLVVDGRTNFPSEELTAVYVGCRMPEESISVVCEAARARQRPIPVRQMFKVPKTLRLESRELP